MVHSCSPLLAVPRSSCGVGNKAGREGGCSRGDSTCYRHCASGYSPPKTLGFPNLRTRKLGELLHPRGRPKSRPWRRVKCLRVSPSARRYSRNHSCVARTPGRRRRGPLEPQRFCQRGMTRSVSFQDTRPMFGLTLKAGAIPFLVRIIVVVRGAPLGMGKGRGVGTQRAKRCRGEHTR